jgi:HEAT repeat protein
MSPLLAPDSGGTWFERLQRDLIAGLNDTNPSARLANIARLGALKMLSSAEPLRRFISKGTQLESSWALYAALRSGDLSVLSRVESVVIGVSEPTNNSGAPNPESRRDAAPANHPGVYGVPGLIALELEHLRDPVAVPALVRILQSAKTDLVRNCASQALEEIQDPRSVPALAEALDDSSPYVRYDALTALSHLAHSSQCTPSVNEAEDSELVRQSQLARQVAQCKTWWTTTGRSLSWPPLQ